MGVTSKLNNYSCFSQLINTRHKLLLSQLHAITNQRFSIAMICSKVMLCSTLLLGATFGSMYAHAKGEMMMDPNPAAAARGNVRRRLPTHEVLTNVISGPSRRRLGKKKGQHKTDQHRNQMMGQTYLRRTAPGLGRRVSVDAGHTNAEHH